MPEQTIEQQLFNKRVDEYITDLMEIQKKHGIVQMAVLKQSPFGIMPDINYFDKETLEKNMGRTPSTPQAEPLKG